MPRVLRQVGSFTGQVEAVCKTAGGDPGVRLSLSTRVDTPVSIGYSHSKQVNVAQLL